uniref:Uncharacterized protein n=1 Tax=Phasianus colchicus TaxID=9054 RepID=A0A669QH38_PHACC
MATRATLYPYIPYYGHQGHHALICPLLWPPGSPRPHMSPIMATMAPHCCPHMYTCVHVCTCISAHIHVCVCLYIYTSMYVHVCSLISTYVPIY